MARRAGCEPVGGGGGRFEAATMSNMARASRRRTRGDIDWVSASEIGMYVYCARLYWLAKVKGLSPGGEGEERLREGVRHHHQHGMRYDWQRVLRKAGLWLLAATVLAAVLLVLDRGGA